MKYIILSLILTAVLTKHIYSQEIKYEDLSAIYISPGLDIAWNFEGDFVIGPKISVGIVRKGAFYNLTFGLSSSKDKIIYPHYYIEAQCGYSSIITAHNTQQFLLLTGFGFGIGIHSKDTKNNISYRLSVFSGDIIFLNANVFYTDRFYPEIGLEGVAPIPAIGLKK